MHNYHQGFPSNPFDSHKVHTITYYLLYYYIKLHHLFFKVLEFGIFNSTANFYLLIHESLLDAGYVFLFCFYLVMRL